MLFFKTTAKYYLKFIVSSTWKQTKKYGTTIDNSIKLDDVRELCYTDVKKQKPSHNWLMHV